AASADVHERVCSTKIYGDVAGADPRKSEHADEDTPDGVATAAVEQGGVRSRPRVRPRCPGKERPMTEDAPTPPRPDSMDPDGLKDALGRTGRMLKSAGLPFEEEEFDEDDSSSSSDDATAQADDSSSSSEDGAVDADDSSSSSSNDAPAST
ncbi:MAG: hypothetical protein JWM90_1805, partial [Thermoleophilia bacterium]|nr:hypothetical protein [Thermoleophilia bacterium]